LFVARAFRWHNAAVLHFLLFACTGSAGGPGPGNDSDTPVDGCSGGAGGGTGGSVQTSGSLSYYRYVPAVLPACAPLVYYGHPGSRPGEVHQGVWEDPSHTGFTALADERGFVFVVPGVNPENEPHDWSLELVPLIDGITGDLMGQYDLDDARVWFTGVSAGGHMASYVGLYDPTGFTGIGVVAAGLGAGGFDYPTTEPSPRLPFYVAHDPKDPVIDYAYSVALAEALDAHGHAYQFEDWTLGNGTGHGWNPDLTSVILDWLDDHGG
jgi:poly(3-hydroxybutyrate) depolymerase